MGPVTAGRDADRTVAAARKPVSRKSISYCSLTITWTMLVVFPSFSPRFPLARSSITARTASRGDRETEQSWEAYQKLVSSQHVTRINPKVGDTLPIEDFVLRL